MHIILAGEKSLRQPLTVDRENPRIEPLPQRGASLSPWTLLLIILAGMAVILPFFIRGIPSGHDFEFHVNSWIDVLNQWKQGIFYPRWASEAQWGYGEARFIFYPPVSWTLGALLGAILPWHLVPAVYVLIALTLSGCSMFFLARDWLEPRDAIFAAVCYAVNPYYLIIVYWRSAFAELLAGALLPLLLLFVLRLERDGRRAALALSLVVAAVWLTNIPSAVMLNYSLALLVLIAAWFHRSPRIVFWGAFAAALGAALAAFYLVPAVFEQKWIQISQVLSPGVRPQDNFLFTFLPDPDHNRFNLLVSLAATAEMIFLAAAAFYSRRWRRRSPVLRLELVAWGVSAGLLMLSLTSLAWMFLPKLRFAQLPWRWLLCLNVALVLLIAMAWKQWPMRFLVYATLLTVLAFGWRGLQPPWWDTKLDIAEMVENQRTSVGYEGTDEYVPSGADPYEVKHDAARVAFEGEGKGTVQIQRWDPESKAFTVEADGAGVLALRLFNYPAWKVEVNGLAVNAKTAETTGQMLVPIQAGESSVHLMFGRTWDRTVGAIVSAVAALLTGILFLVWRMAPAKRILVATSNSGKLRDFAGAAAAHGIEIATLPNFSSLPPVIEDGETFEANARKKAEAYSRHAPGEIVLADDSGLEVDALNGAPGVHSARYAADDPQKAESNTDDEANNARLLREVKNIAPEKRTGRFVCVIAAARDGNVLQVFQGTAEGLILDQPRGSHGFGYDPLFYFPVIKKTFAELTAKEKSHYSHRGAAFRKFLAWCAGS